MADWLLRPYHPEQTRILFLARHAADDLTARPVVAPAALPGYADYHANLRRDLADLGFAVRSAANPFAVTAAAGSVDLVFSLLNRMPMRNPELLVPSLCAALALPCVGAPPNIRALAEDKYVSKLAFRALGLPVPDGMVYRPAGPMAPPPFPGPYFVKDRFGAASEGIDDDALQGDWHGAAAIVTRLLAQQREVLVERYCPGIDVTMPVLGGLPYRVLGFVAPQSDRRGGILTAALKVDDHLGNLPVDVGDSAPAMHEDARILWQALGPIDYFRVDYRWDPATGRRFILEINICCYLGRHGALCLAAAPWGYQRPEILGHIVEYSLRRHRAVRHPGDG